MACGPGGGVAALVPPAGPCGLRPLRGGSWIGWLRGVCFYLMLKELLFYEAQSCYHRDGGGDAFGELFGGDLAGGPGGAVRHWAYYCLGRLRDEGAAGGGGSGAGCYGPHPQGRGPEDGPLYPAGSYCRHRGLPSKRYYPGKHQSEPVRGHGLQRHRGAAGDRGGARQGAPEGVGPDLPPFYPYEHYQHGRRDHCHPAGAAGDVFLGGFCLRQRQQRRGGRLPADPGRLRRRRGVRRHGGCYHSLGGGGLYLHAGSSRGDGPQPGLYPL